MTRWLRRLWLLLFHAVSLVAVGLFFVVLIFWVRSHWILDTYQFPSTVLKHAHEGNDGRTWMGCLHILSLRGNVTLEWFRYQYTPIALDGNVERAESIWYSKPHYVSRQLWPSARQMWLDDGHHYYRDATEKWSLLGFTFSKNDATPFHTMMRSRLTSFRAATPPMSTHWRLTMPYWAVLLLTSVWPIIWLLVLWRGVRRLKRMAAGYCGKCNYDLQGKPNLDACPECGTVPPTKR